VNEVDLRYASTELRIARLRAELDDVVAQMPWLARKLLALWMRVRA
jgi:hypothetical protein